MSESPQGGSRQPPLRVCLLGSEGAGKTCFLAGLAVLAEPDGSPVGVAHCDEVTAAYFDDLRRTLHRRQWPPPTTMTTLLTTRVTIDGQVLEIKVVDYPGEDFRAALRKLERERVEELSAHLQHADALMLLFDPERDLQAHADPRERERQVERQLAHLQAVSELDAERARRGRGRHRKFDVGIVVTKCDAVPELARGHSAKRFFRGRVQAVDESICNFADNVSYFALSAVGNCKQGNDTGGLFPGDKVSPCGYAEVFRWVLKRKRHRQYARRWFGVGTSILATVLLTVGWLGWERIQRERAITILGDPDVQTVEAIRRTAGINNATVQEKAAQRVRERLESLSSQTRAASNEVAIDVVLAELEKLLSADPRLVKGEIEQTIRAARERKEELLFQQVENAQRMHDVRFVSLAQRYLSEYPGSHERCETVRNWLHAERQERMTAARRRIRQMRVTNAATLQSKAESVFSFLREFGSDLPGSEQKQMQRAADLAKRFGEPNFYQATLKRSGGFASPWQQGVRLQVGEEPILTRKSSGKSRDVTWAPESARFQWSAGQPIQLSLQANAWSVIWWETQDTATLADRGPTALRILGGLQTLSQFADGWQEHCPKAFVHFEVEGIGADDWRALEHYVLPGEAW